MQSSWAINFGNDCVVSELGRKVPLWSLKLPTNFFTPKFSPDGQFLLAASNDQSRVVIYTAESGEPIDSLVGTKGEIVGLAVAPTGIVFAWNEVGAVTAWDLDTRTILHQFTPFGPI